MDPLIREAAHVWFGRHGPIALKLNVSGEWAYVRGRQGLVKYGFRRYPLRHGRLRICRISKCTPMARTVPNRDIRRREKKVQSRAAGRTG